MCGFAALIGYNGYPADRKVVERMTSTLLHRGPDDSGIECWNTVGLGFRRLSILDLTPSGHQPMTTQDGRYTIVFNGEIYNFIELRSELQTLGYEFRSRSDTEVLLCAYIAWGSECLQRLNGMWAFVILDRASGRTFGARDRFGMKPLYRYRSGQYMLLASEIKAIRASGLVLQATNWKVAAAFLMAGALDESNETFYSGIDQLPPGCAFELDLDGTHREWRYWNLAGEGGPSVADPAAEFARLFEDSVRVHMRSDVPVGITLSGGMDSTSIICASARVRREANAVDPLLAFCYMSPEFDESPYIQDTLRQTGATLVRIETNGRKLWDDLPKVIWYHDEPVHALNVVIGYQLMGLAAANGVKVVLGGQGADETIGGYHSYFKDYWCSLLQNRQFRHAWRETGVYGTALGKSRVDLLSSSIRHLLFSILHKNHAYRSWAAARTLRRVVSSATWFTPEFKAHFFVKDDMPSPGLNSILEHSTRVSPLPLYLREEDRNAMAHSVEARLPFLDYRLVELVSRMTPEWHMRGAWNKYVLRAAMQGKIPESVRVRVDKMGFNTPERSWLTNELREPVLDILHSRAARERGIYDLPRVLRDFDRHCAGEINIAPKAIDLAQFEMWVGMTGGDASVQGRNPVEAVS